MLTEVQKPPQSKVKEAVRRKEIVKEVVKEKLLDRTENLIGEMAFEGIKIQRKLKGGSREKAGDKKQMQALK